MPKTLSLCLLLVLGSVACTHQVRPNPAPLRAQSAPLPLRVRYFIPPEQKARMDSDNYLALGLAHTWNIHIGEALARSFPQMLGTVFQSVHEASGSADIADADVLLIPKIEHFDVGSGNFVSELRLAVHARGAEGEAVLLNEVFVATPKDGEAGAAWVGGAFAGQTALQRSAEYAFEDVMPKIAQKLRDVFSKLSPKSSVRMMNDKELLGKALHVAREASLLLLRKQGTVLPFGLTLDAAGDNPKTWFPRDQLPRASLDELLDATVGHLERSSSSGDVGAIALATTLESGSKSGLGIQVETRTSSLFLVYPYSGSGQNWSLEEPQTAEGLLVGPLLATKRR